MNKPLWQVWVLTWVLSIFMLLDALVNVVTLGGFSMLLRHRGNMNRWKLEVK